MRKEILVVGCGSIGERHLRCFLTTGRAGVTACDTNPALLQRMQSEYQTPGFSDLKAALGSRAFDGVVICTPAHTHIAIARLALKYGAPLLIEKPLSVGLDGLDDLRREIEQAKRFVGIAYVYHLMPCVQQAREFILQGSLGKMLQVSVAAGQHFPTFRPAYREIYYNNHATGGGAVQDALTHLVNAVEWIAGPMTRVYCEAAHQALEGVTVEDTVSVTAKHGAIVAAYSMNQFQAPNETVMQVHCERGSVKIEVHEQRWSVFPRGASGWEHHPTPVGHRDDLFIAQANAFLDGVEGKENPLCTFDEAVQTLKFNMAALESARSGRALEIT